MNTPSSDAAERTRARRERQLGEIVTAIVDGQTARAAGLAAEHGHEFPGDATMLDELLTPRSPRDRRC